MSFFKIPSSILEELCFEWIYPVDLANLDTAVCNTRYRSSILSVLSFSSLGLEGLGPREEAWEDYLCWINMRNLSPKSLCVSNFYFLSVMNDLAHLGRNLISLQVDWFDISGSGPILQDLLSCSTLQGHLTALAFPYSSGYSFLSFCPLSFISLRSLELPSCTEVLDDSLLMFLRGCSDLEKLNLSGCEMSSSWVLCSLSRHCRSLHTLLLANVNFYDGSLVVDAWINDETGFHSLQTLDVSSCRHLSSDNVCLLIHAFPELRNLYLTRISNPAILTAILQSSIDTLCELDISSCFRATGNNQNFWLEGGAGALGAEGDALILPLPQIEQLFLSFFSTFFMITSLDLSNIYILNDSLLISIVQNCVELASINLTYCSRLTDNSILALTKCCKDSLTSCNFSYCDLISDFAVCQLIEHCKSLTSLILTSCIQLTDYTIIKLSELNDQLTCLGISGCVEITEASVYGFIASYHSNQRFRIFDVSDNHWMDDLLLEKIIKELRSLLKLYLGYCQNIISKDFKEFKQTRCRLNIITDGSL
jgi:hypothetical protein